MAHLLLKSALLAGIVVMAAVPVATSVLHVSPGAVVDALRERTAGETIRYLQRRLEGHDRLAAAARPVLTLIQREVERPVPSIEWPSLGKGPQSHSLPLPMYGADGRPHAVRATGLAEDEPRATTLIHSAADLLRSVAAAQAGDVLEMLPGLYTIREVRGSRLIVGA